MKSAEQQVLESIDELLAGQDDSLVMPMTTLNQATAKVVDQNAKIITRLQEKVIKAADRDTTRQLDQLDGVYTRVLEGLNLWQEDANFLLTQLAAKGGFTKAGEPLEAALQKEVTEAPQLAYAGTLVLAVKEAIPFFEQLIEVLREIRDRLPGVATDLRGEPPAKYPADDEVESDERTELAEVADSEIDWPEV
jgi:hypothetical protein